MSSKPFVLVLENNSFRWFCEEIDEESYRLVAQLEPGFELPNRILPRDKILQKIDCRFDWIDANVYESAERDDCEFKVTYLIHRFASYAEFSEMFPKLAQEIFLISL